MSLSNSVDGAVKSEMDSKFEVPLNSLSLSSTSVVSPSDASVKSRYDSNTPAEPSDRETATGTPIKSSTSHSRSSRSRKPPPRREVLFLDAEDQYHEATSNFEVIPECNYANKSIGSTEPAIDCECSDEWDSATQSNQACGDDSDCINRATKMECIKNCSCGENCENQRFQRKMWAPVTVIKTDMKGYGLRADADMRPHDFIFEYIGEVISEPTFRKRMRTYDQEGIKHFYFMSLNKGEFIDATKKGNLGRFCNHSCNPNCYVDKWVVGDKLRMGIFAERAIKKGEELVFNYNVDRYGADPQKCFCGEENCKGFIGGKTQTETGPKLSAAAMEALGLEDYDDDFHWEAAIKKSKKSKKSAETDEEYVDQLKSKNLEEDGVTTVMAQLMQTKEEWFAVKLLTRIQTSPDEKVPSKVVRMHGYRILKATLSNFIENTEICLQVLDILFKLPRITRNKIQDSGIEDTISKLQDGDNELVVKQASEILKIWSQLKVGYRIPRVKLEQQRRDRSRSRSRERARSAEKEIPQPPTAPTGPKSNTPQRGPGFHSARPHKPRPTFSDLPAGWNCVTDKATGRLYYYSANGERTWTRPTAPAVKVEKPATIVKEMSHEERLQQIINSVTKNNTPKGQSPAIGTPQPTKVEPEIKLNLEEEESWKSYPEEKQKRIYENTLYPHIKHVIDKYKHKLPKEDIKRFAKEISKKLVNSDFKHNRVTDLQNITPKQERGVKKFVKEFFDKAVVKHNDYEKQRALREGRQAPETNDEEVKLTDDEADDDSELKRKRHSEADQDHGKKPKVEGEPDTPIIPPPPPPTSQNGLTGDPMDMS